MYINVKTPAVEQGETTFRRITKEKDRKKVQQGGTLHLERIYASGGMIVTEFHNYVTNQLEVKHDSIGHALEKFEAIRDMQRKSPDWVDDGLPAAILKAVRAAQKQINEGNGIVEDMGDPTLEDIEEECAEISALIAQARAADPELDAEMTAIEKEAKKKNKVKN